MTKLQEDFEAWRYKNSDLTGAALDQLLRTDDNGDYIEDMIRIQWEAVKWRDDQSNDELLFCQSISDNWEECAAQMHRNAEFYRSLVVQIGEMFGEEAYTSDDGSVQDSVLALRVPDLVRVMIDTHPSYKE